MSSKNVYEQFLSQCDNGFVVIDNDCSIIETNNAISELTGYNHDELNGTGLYVLFDNFTAEKICTLCDCFGCKKIRQKISGDLYRKDGEIRQVEVSINCTGTEDKSSHWLLIKNKSFRKEMEVKLRQSELMLQSTLESLPFDFWINDAENRTYMQNSHSKALWGDVKGHSPKDVTDDDGISENWLKTTTRALAGEVINGEISYIINGRKKYFRNILAPIKDEEHMLGILGMNIDITDLKEAV